MESLFRKDLLELLVGDVFHLHVIDDLYVVLHGSRTQVHRFHW